mgnify:CR=1 FL=1
MKISTTATKKAKKLLAQAGVNLDSLDVSGGCSIDVNKIAEDVLKITVVPHPFTNEISGVFFKKDGKLFIGVNSTHNDKRNRFTIAHEIGHYLLHAGEALHYDDSSKLPLVAAYFRSDNVANEVEREANHFAAELLMPAELIAKCVEANIKSTTALAERFNVSEQAMTYRLVNLGYL